MMSEEFDILRKPSIRDVIDKQNIKLKTLKELEWNETWWEDGYWSPKKNEKELLLNGKKVSHKDCAGGEPDSSLEDLKVNINNLKQEAIKWIKYYRDLGLFGEAVSIGRFLNITEGDLK